MCCSAGLIIQNDPFERKQIINFFVKVFDSEESFVIQNITCTHAYGILRVLPTGILPALLTARTSRLSVIPVEDPHIVASFLPCPGIISPVKISEFVDISEDYHLEDTVL
jgi:hypothetical protein